MLPKSLFDRISSAYGLKSGNSPRDRRQSVRADLRLKALVCNVDRGRSGPPVLVRVREMSQGGLSMVHPSKVRVGQDLLVRLVGRDNTQYWLWGRCRRCQAADHLCNIVAVSFTRVLYPGQDIRTGTELEYLMWLDVDGVEPSEDPYAAAA